MKKLLSLVAALALVFTLGACGNDDDTTNPDDSDVNKTLAEQLQDANITLEFWHAQTSSNEEAMNAVVDLFNETNEYNITVNPTSQGGYSDCDTKVVSALSADAQPNITQAYNNNIMGYMPSNKVLQLDDYLNDDLGLTAADKATIVKAYWDENAAYPDGHIYSVSLGKSTEVMYYNKTFFEENNLEVPTTYAELTEVAKQASEILGKPAFGWDSLENLMIYGLQNFGAEYATADGTLLFGNAENRDKTLAFLEWWQEGVRGGYFRDAGEDNYLSGPFGDGNVVMFVGSCSGVFYITPKDFEADVAPVPFGEYPTVIQQGGNFCGFTSGDDLTDLATSIFLEFLYTPEASALYASKTGYAPSNSAALDEQVYKDCIAADDLNARAKNVASNYDEDARGFDPVFDNSYNVRKECGNILEEVTLDPTADCATVLDEVYAELTK